MRLAIYGLYCNTNESPPYRKSTEGAKNPVYFEVLGLQFFLILGAEMF